MMFDTSQEGWTALMWAACGGYASVVDQLLKHNASVDIQSNVSVVYCLKMVRKGFIVVPWDRMVVLH